MDVLWVLIKQVSKKQDWKAFQAGYTQGYLQGYCKDLNVQNKTFIYCAQTIKMLSLGNNPFFSAWDRSCDPTANIQKLEYM